MTEHAAGILAAGTPRFTADARKALAGPGFRVRASGASVSVVVKAAESFRPAVVLIEASRKAGALAALAALKKSHAASDAAAVLVAERDSASFRKRAMKLGAADVAAASEGAEGLRRSVARALAARGLEIENRRLQREARLYRTVKSVATVLDMDRLMMALTDAAVELSCAKYGAFARPKTSGGFETKEIRGVSRDRTPRGGAFGFTREALKRFMAKTAPTVPVSGEFRPARMKAGVKARSVAAVPLGVGRKRHGLLLVARGTDAPAFCAEDMHILQKLAAETVESVENAAHHQRVQELTLRDDLTSAYNRRYFETCVEDEIRRARRFKTQTALIFMDLDNLRLINDKHGHFMGSHALMEAAHRMLDSIRGIDKLVRFGGDEFCVVLPETGVQGARIVAERILKRVREEKFIMDKVPGGAKLTVSIGIASYPEHALTKEDLIKRADEAMYHVKTQGKGTIAVAKPLKKKK